MKTKTIFLALALAFLLTACSRQPKITLETTSLDMGDVINGTVVTKEIAVTNTGTAPLHIEGVSTSCGCTTAEISPQTIKPGEQGILHIQFDSGAHGPDSVGKLQRSIFISTNASDQGEVTFEFVVNVLPRVEE